MIEIAPGVHAIVNWVELDGRVSWSPASAGWEPASVYLVDCGREALLFDNGLPGHREAILTELRAGLEGRTLGLWLSRMVEPDAIGNTLAVLDTLPVRRVLNSTHTNQLRMLTPRWAEFSDGRGYSIERVGWGERFEFGERLFEAVRPAARVIATSWLYEPASKVLFTSDFFSHVHRAAASDSPVTVGEDVSAEEVRRHLAAKYEWLADAETAPIVDRLEAIFREHEVDVIAPGHGCVISGAEAVRAHVAATAEAIRTLGVLPVGSEGDARTG